MWFDHVKHMEEGPEQNKEWEKFWWTVDEDMFTYVMKTNIEELIDEKSNHEFPEEVEIRETMIVKKKRPQRPQRQMKMNQKQIMQVLITIWTLQIWR